ncbi:metallophosphoesterase family protein [Anaerolineales bacterium]
MRLAILSDIHGNKVAFDAVLKDLSACGDFDAIWILGDLCAFGPEAHACLESIYALIEQYGKDTVKVIGGNTDRYLVTGERSPSPFIENETDFQKFVTTTSIKDTILNWNLADLTYADYSFLMPLLGKELRKKVADFGTILAVHAVPGDDESMALRPDTPDEEALDVLMDREACLFLVGHTHIRMDRKIGNRRVINPGSVGMSLTQKTVAEWAILTFQEADLEVDFRDVPYDFDLALQTTLDRAYPEPEWLINILK